MILTPGQELAGRYRVIRELGQGGFGRVFLAEELERTTPQALAATLRLNLEPPLVLRKVAIKTFSHPERLGKALACELRALCRLSHPNIVSLFDYQLADPPFIVMEYVPGENLENRLDKRGPFALLEALSIALQIGEALSHAHANSLLHRDIKPANVLVTEDLRAKLVDFGLARSFERLGRLVTQVGTPGFVAPELLDPERFRYPVGLTADVYGFGCLVAALLLGDSPFQGDTPVQILRRQMEGQRNNLDSLPSAIRSLIDKATALLPSQRYQSLPEMLAELRQIQCSLLSGSQQKQNDQLLDLIDARVSSIEPFNHPVRGNGFKLEISCNDNGDLKRAFFYEDKLQPGSQDLFQSLQGIWSGSQLSLYQALIVESPRKGSFLTAGPATLPIIEPHLLVTVSDLVAVLGAAAPHCSARPFVDLRQRKTHSTPLLTGRILHQALDRLATTPTRSTNPDILFDSLFSECRLAAIAAGMTSANVNPLRERLRTSLEWLVDYAQKHLEGPGRFAEVTRYSGRYGLEGRIDLAILNPQRLDIIELKTGKHQRADHVAQLGCYSLLWDAYAKSLQRPIKSRLLYSKVALEKELPGQTHHNQLLLLRARNGLLAAHHRLAQGRIDDAMPHFGQWPERCQDHPCRYRAESCREQSALIGLGPWSSLERSANEPYKDLPRSLIQPLRAYYRHFVRLLEKEYLAQSRAHGEFTRSSLLPHRISEDIVVSGATLLEWDRGSCAVRFLGRGLDRFLPGSDLVAHRGDPEGSAMLIGRVQLSDQEGIVIKTEGVDMCPELPRRGWHLEPLIARIGYREAHQALYGLLANRNQHQIRQILPGRRPNCTFRTWPEQDLPLELDSQHPSPLNPTQREALSLALHHDGPLLIHGPPGTGKTTLISHITRELVKRNTRVLLAAGTNTALDNILMNLMRAGVDFLRLGPLDSGSPLWHSLDTSQLATRVAPKLESQVASLDAIIERLRRAPVVAGTAHRCIRSDAISAIERVDRDAKQSHSHSPPFDVAIIDEASQIIEPLSLGVVLLAKRFILVGDKRQLPPVITSDEARSVHFEPHLDPLARELDLGGLDKTLFERLSGKCPEISLDIQYRMNNTIQQLANLLYYQGQLQAHHTNHDRQLDLDRDRLRILPPELYRRWDPEQPLVWENLEVEVEGRRNLTEADAIATTIGGLLTSGLVEPSFASRIGVISPFRAQCFAIKKALEEMLGAPLAAQIEVDTVERFQGRQKEVMLVSLVVREWSDFVMEPRRLNVAFTRARSKLIVFGPMQPLFEAEERLIA